MNSAFELGLRKVVGEEIERLHGTLESRAVVQSYEDYTQIVGQIAALRRVVDSYCDEVNDLINKG